MPRILASFASSIDGSIADFRGMWKPLCPYELERYQKTLDESDAIIVGWRTVVDSGLPFNPRVEKKKFLKVLLDPALKVSSDHRFYRDMPDFVEIVTLYSKYYVEQTSPHLKLIAKKKRVKLWAVSGIRIEPEKVVEILKKEGVQLATLMGGGRLLYSFLKQGAIDSLRLTITPYFLGSNIRLVNGIIGEYPGVKARLFRVEVCPCGQEVILYYKL